ncbi:MAG: DNA glycosylase AlkZ-like family protein [Alistipes putredinis]
MLPLITLRLQNQLLVQPPFDAPQQVVEWMGAVQAQDYRMAKWAVGCRTASTDATQIEAALNRGDILRTHLLRPTWHFVSSKDLRWMLSLTADRIRAANDSYARGTDAALDSKSIHRYMNLLQKTLEGNKHRTKEEIGEALNQRGIPLAICAAASADAGRNGRHRLQRRRQEGHRDLRPSRRTGSARRRTFP